MVKLFTYLRHQIINRHRQQINAQGEGVQLQSKLSSETSMRHSRPLVFYFRLSTDLFPMTENVEILKRGRIGLSKRYDQGEDQVIGKLL